MNNKLISHPSQFPQDFCPLCQEDLTFSYDKNQQPYHVHCATAIVADFATHYHIALTHDRVGFKLPNLRVSIGKDYFNTWKIEAYIRTKSGSFSDKIFTIDFFPLDFSDPNKLENRFFTLQNFL